jgi:acyl-CoA oxidase
METAARRLTLLQRSLTRSVQGCEDALEAAGLSSCFTPELNTTRLKIASGLSLYSDLILNAFEQDKFPSELKAVVKGLDIVGINSVADSSRPRTFLEEAAILYEVAKFDGSVATFVQVQHDLVIHTILHLASDALKAKYLQPLCRLDMVGAWALTEPDYGSDAAALIVTASPVEGGYRLNGYK